MPKQTICLNMIVKNESAIIRETLDNVVAHLPISYWVICDTGSTDGTQEIICSFFKEKGIVGELHEEEWHNFSHNRNSALKHCHGKSDYILIWDADDRFEGSLNLPRLTAGAYSLKLNLGDVEYYRPLLLQNNESFYWRGVTHEFIELQGATKVQLDGNYRIIAGVFGARSHDPYKYLKDAQALEVAFNNPSDDDLKPRYAFYCAQSYRDAQQYEKAAEWYEKRIGLWGWREEVGCAYYNLGLCYAYLGRNRDALITWQMGYDYDPTRLESLYQAIFLLRNQKKYRLAYQFAKIAAATPYPKSDILFVQKEIYDLWIYHELGYSARFMNDLETGYEACKKVLLQNPNLETQKECINNLQYYIELALKDSIKNRKQLAEKIETYHSNQEDETALVILDKLNK